MFSSPKQHSTTHKKGYDTSSHVIHETLSSLQLLRRYFHSMAIKYIVETHEERYTQTSVECLHRANTEKKTYAEKSYSTHCQSRANILPYYILLPARWTFFIPGENKPISFFLSWWICLWIPFLYIFFSLPRFFYPFEQQQKSLVSMPWLLCILQNFFFPSWFWTKKTRMSSLFMETK